MHVFLKATPPRDFCSLPIPYRYVTYVLQLCMKILDAEGVFYANLQHFELQNILSTTHSMTCEINSYSFLCMQHYDTEIFNKSIHNEVF